MTVPWDGSVPCHPYDSANIVYVEVPRAGCTSTKMALARFLGWPDGIEDIHQWTGYTMARDHAVLSAWLKHRWRSYFKFTIVRHPVARFQSFYYGMEGSALDTDINAFIRSHSKHVLDIHAQPQRHIIGDPSLYDLVARLEDLSVLENALHLRGIEVAIPHINPTRAERAPLTEESLAWIRSAYADDFEEFGYR